MQDTLQKEKLAYYGENFIETIESEPGNEYQEDLIIMKDGRWMSSKITGYSGSSYIEYAFLLGEKEMKARIKKREVAFYKKAFKATLDLQSVSQDYYLGAWKDIMPQQGSSVADNQSCNYSGDLKKGEDSMM